MSERQYKILLREEPEGGYTVTVPVLPGCVTFGKTLNEAIEMAGMLLKSIWRTWLQQGGSPADHPPLICPHMVGQDNHAGRSHRGDTDIRSVL